MTSWNAVSARTSKVPRRISLRSERETCASSGTSTKRGSGQNQSSGTPSWGQGKIPRRRPP